MKEGLVLFVIFAGLSLLYDMAKKKKTGIVKTVAKYDNLVAIPKIENMIFSLKDIQVVLDNDFAMLYSEEMKYLRSATK